MLISTTFINPTLPVLDKHVATYINPYDEFHALTQLTEKVEDRYKCVILFFKINNRDGTPNPDCTWLLQATQGDRVVGVYSPTAVRGLEKLRNMLILEWNRHGVHS